ncbi:MAG: hypothetical protein ACXVHV_07505, partial [Methanobacterium sp.]
IDDETKAEMLQKSRAAIFSNDLNKWTSDQLKDIEAVIVEREELKSKRSQETSISPNVGNELN